MSSTTNLTNFDIKHPEDVTSSRCSSITSSIDIPPVTRATTTSTTSKSSTFSKRQKLKSFFKRIGNGLIESLAYASAVEYAPAAVQYHDRRTPDQVLNDIYGVQLAYW